MIGQHHSRQDLAFYTNMKALYKKPIHFLKLPGMVPCRRKPFLDVLGRAPPYIFGLAPFFRDCRILAFFYHRIIFHDQKYAFLAIEILFPNIP